MQISDLGKAFIKSFEGLSLTNYLDQGGRQTVGYGHLWKVQDGLTLPLTQESADALFEKDVVERAEWPVSSALAIGQSQNQFDALVSLCYNIGEGAFAASSLLRYINANMEQDLLKQSWLNWCHVGQNVSKGLLLRREAEWNIYSQGTYLNNGASI